MKIWKAKSNLKLKTKKLNDKIDWLNHFIGFLVVILGILIAFQLNENSQESSKEKLIEKHIDNIRKESSFNLKNLKSAIAYGEQQLNDLDTMLVLIRQKRSMPRINRLSIKLLNLGGSYLRRSAYALFLESGDMRFMNDFEEQKKIINLYEFYDWLETFNTTATLNYREDYYPYLRDNMDLATGQLAKPEIYFSKKFANIIATYRYSLSGKLGKYKDCQDRIEEYLERQEMFEELEEE